jgi:uncharacterized membrane protein YhhN
MDLVRIHYFVPLLAVLLAVFCVREAVTYHGKIGLKYIFTPLVTMLTAGFVVLSIYEHDVTAYRTLILSALAFSLIADTMLMIVEVDLLKNGILFFMLAHLMYIIAFSLEYESRGWHLAIVAVMLVVIWQFFRGIRGHVGAFEIPILLYAIVLSTMLFFAITSLSQDISRKTVLLFIGAVMFAISDFLLAFLSFIRPHKQESVIVWAIYAPAQLLIALSCFS